LLVRHLVMPNGVAGSEQVFNFLAEEVSTNTYLNVMDQYRPCGPAHRDEFVDRRLTSREFGFALDAARKAGLKRLDSRERMRLVLGI
jgi:putative pyruvate formate lyase activating enzyme